MKIRIVPVRVYEVRSDDGSVVGLFGAIAEWEGLLKLSAIDGKSAGQVIIADPKPSDAFSAVFGAIFEEKATEATVVKASPELTARLVPKVGA
jgi:hypothetical protein